MRLVSLTFDDGMISTARLATRSLPGVPMTFFLVTGWIDGLAVPDDPPNRSVDHGTTAQWKELEASGHELACHGHSHKRASHPDYPSDCHRASEWFQKPVPLALPYGDIGRLPPGFTAYKAGEFVTYNELPVSKRPLLASVNPVWDHATQRARPFRSIYEILDRQPDQTWLIVTLHGIEEGWGPITLAEFVGLGSYLTRSDHVVRTLSGSVP